MRRVGVLGWLACLMVAVVPLAWPRPAAAQVNTTNLSGRVLGPKGKGVAKARVRIQNLATTAAREITTNAKGDYLFLGLPPGDYQLTALARHYATFVNHDLRLPMGERTIYNIQLETMAQARGQTETVTTQPAFINPTHSSTLVTISGADINDLPINLRDYLRFSLLSSAVKRDDTPPGGAMPTSGLDINSQRGRENDFTLNGGDAADAAVGGVRSTVPLDAVWEFQVLANNYMPEYGRATAGVVNVLTKSGTDEFHGSVFGYLRNQRVQARNPFALAVDPVTGKVKAMNPPYTRLQGGATLGGALQQNKFFYFVSFEALRTQGTGYSSIGAGNFGMSEAAIPCVTGQQLLTPQQASFFQKAIPAAGGCGSTAAAPLVSAASIYGQASATALNGVADATAELNNETNALTSFPLPVDCNRNVLGSCGTGNVVPLPASYVGLRSLIGTYPIRNRSEIGSIRLDRIWSSRQRSSVLFSISPSNLDGIEVNSVNQNVGLNAGTRTSQQRFLDQTAVAQHTILLSSTLLNQTRFEYARRGLHFGPSPLTGGSNVGVNIAGYAYLGQEPLTTVDRAETRWEGSDNLTWVKGSHSFKFGLDAGILKLRSSKPQIYQPNSGGVFNFTSLDPSVLGNGLEGLPALTPVQAYGLGMPQNFVQEIGQSYQPFDDKMLGAFAQDSWQLGQRLTINYGVRYDLGLMPEFPGATTLNQNALAAMHVVEGVPRDYKDIAPRLGIAWDPTGSGKTVVRAGFGLFYGVAPLALAYNSASVDGGASSQFEAAAGTATGAAISADTSLQALNAASIFQGTVGGIPTVTSAGSTICGLNVPNNLGYQCAQQRFNPALSGALFAGQEYLTEGYAVANLPFTLPTASNFKNAYSEQGNLTIERQLGHDYKVSVSYTYIHSVHLYRSRNINQANPVLLTQNYRNAIEAGLQPSGPLSVMVPEISPGSCQSTSGTSSVLVLAAGELGEGYGTPNCTGTALGYIGTPAAFNFFRPSGPNPSYAGPSQVNYGQMVTLAKQAGYPTGFGVPVAWSDVLQQESSGTSSYNGLTVTVSKRYSQNFELFSSWTWSHAIDNSTGLSTLLNPQNNLYPNLERGNSSFDQRHRWVTSAIIASPYRRVKKGFWKKLLSNAYLAPIVEFSTGRPYTVLTGTDYNMNFNAYTDRPSVVKAGTAGSVSSPYLPNVAFAAPTTCPAGLATSAKSPFGQTIAIAPYGCTGNLGRNTFYTPDSFNLDLRLDKRIYLGETMNLEFIADGFNLLNRNNTMSVSTLCNPVSGTCSAGEPTAAFHPREFQFSVRFNF